MNNFTKHKITTLWSGFTLHPRASSLRSKNGFTLIEIMVSVAIFTVIITVGMGSLVSILRNYEVTQSQKKVHDGLNSTLESMTREIRLGRNYSSGATSANQLPDDGVSDESLGFFASDSRGYVRYYLNDGAIMVERTGATAANGTFAITDNTQLNVSDIRFTVIGTDTTGAGNYQQPYVWIQIKANSLTVTERDTVVQTLVTQRSLDF